MDDTLTIFLKANAGRRQRFLLQNAANQKLGSVQTHGWSNLWNQFFGWLIAMPVHDEMAVDGNTLTVESKTHLLSGKYRIEINHQPVALVLTRNFQSGYLINIKNERYVLKPGLGNASFKVFRSGESTPVMQMQQQIDDADKFKIDMEGSFGLLTGVGLAMIIMRDHGK